MGACGSHRQLYRRRCWTFLANLGMRCTPPLVARTEDPPLSPLDEGCMPLKELGSRERFLQWEGGRRRENRKEPGRAEAPGGAPGLGVTTRLLCEPEQVAFLFWDSVFLPAKPEGWSSVWSANGERQRKLREEGWTGHGGERGPSCLCSQPGLCEASFLWGRRRPSPFVSAL